MATTINLSSSPIRGPSSLRLHYLRSSQNTLSFSFFYSHPNPSSFTFPSISLRPKPSTKPRHLSAVVSALTKLTESELVTVPSEPNELAGKFPSDSGVYAVYDKNGDCQFVGISRNIAASVLFHLKSVPELCSSVKVTYLPELCFSFLIILLEECIRIA